MARMAVQEKATAVAAPMKYNRDNSAEVTELEELQKERDAIAVSYTHLTLPTIYSV